MKLTEVLALDGSNARSLCVDGDVLYVGTEWDDDRDGNAVFVLDRKTHAMKKAWKMPFLVSDIVVVGDTCYAALGPGKLARLYDRGLGTAKPSFEDVDPNAPKLVTDGTELWWGTSWGEIHQLDRGRVANVKKSLHAIALDAERVYAGYEDGKLRVFDRSDGKRLKIVPIGTRKVYCAFDERLFTIDGGGVVKRWSADWKVETTFEHDPGDVQWGIIGIDVFGDRVVTRTYKDLRVWTRDGKQLLHWESGPLDINAAVIAGDGMFVAVGTQVMRFPL